MDAVLRFVDNEKPVSAVGERQGGTEKPRRAVAEASQGYGSLAVAQLYDGPTTVRPVAEPAIADHRHPVHLVAENEAQSLDDAFLVRRQRDLVPELGDPVVVQHTRAQGPWQTSSGGTLPCFSASFRYMRRSLLLVT